MPCICQPQNGIGALLRQLRFSGAEILARHGGGRGGKAVVRVGVGQTDLTADAEDADQAQYIDILAGV